jgi:hypothetical protein
MLYNLVEVAADGADQFVRLPAGRFVDAALDRIGELADQLARQRRVIVDEIERVLDLMRDARRELAEGGELLRLDEAVLRLAQIVERGGYLSRPRLPALIGWACRKATISGVQPDSALSRISSPSRMKRVTNGARR